MSDMHHHAVIATTWSKDEADRVRKRIEEAGLEQHFLFAPPTKRNVQWTVFMPPDGSQEGWDESDVGDDRRDWFVDLLKESVDEEGGYPWQWLEVGYGDYGQEIVRGYSHGDDEEEGSQE